MALSNHCIKTLIFATGIALATSNAFSQTFDAVRLNAALAGRDGGTVGIAVLAGHEYQGADTRRTLVLPWLNYQWTNGWFAGVTNGIGYNFSNSPHMQYGLRLTPDLGRKENRASALRGMGDIKATTEGGAFFNYALPQGLLLTSSIRYGAGVRHKGVLVDLGVGYSTEVAATWRLGAGAAMTLANADYMQSFFGVTGDQSAASGYVAYTPGGGARDVRANVTLTYLISRRTSITTALSVGTLLGNAKDSPLTRKRTSESGVVAMTYAF